MSLGEVGKRFAMPVGGGHVGGPITDGGVVISLEQLIDKANDLDRRVVEMQHELLAAREAIELGEDELEEYHRLVVEAESRLVDEGDMGGGYRDIPELADNAWVRKSLDWLVDRGLAVRHEEVGPGVFMFRARASGAAAAPADAEPSRAAARDEAEGANS